MFPFACRQLCWCIIANQPSDRAPESAQCLFWLACSVPPDSMTTPKGWSLKEGDLRLYRFWEEYLQGEISLNPVSQLRDLTFWGLGSSLLWRQGLSYVSKGVWQHPWPLPTRWHPHYQFATTKNVFRRCQISPVEWFYEDLQDLLELTPRKDVLFIIGDWNAKIGSQETPGVTGTFGLGVQNEAGQRPREHTSHSKHPLPATQEKTLHMDITRWPTLQSDWL